MKPKSSSRRSIAQDIVEDALSFTTSTSRRVSDAQPFSASSAMPLESPASPTTATTCSEAPLRSRATASPSAAASAAPACPATNASHTDSSGFGKPEMPPKRRSVPNRSARPVSNFQA